MEDRKITITVNGIVISDHVTSFEPIDISKLLSPDPEAKERIHKMVDGRMTLTLTYDLRERYIYRRALVSKLCKRRR